MTEFEFTSTMVKTLKGAPLSVLMLLVLAKQPVSAQYLERESGYSDKAVNSALLYLADHGWTTRNGRYSWQIANGVRALPLMPELDEPGEETPAEEEVCAQTVDPEDGSRRNSESEKFRVPSSSKSLTTSIERELTTTTSDPESEKFRVSEVLQECIRAGIWQKRAEAIGAMPHVSGRMVRYWTQWAASKHKDLPLAIWRIEHNAPVPEDWIDTGGSEARTIEETTDPGQEEPLPAEAFRVWEAALIILEKQFKRVEYETWIKSLALSGYGVSGYVLRTGNKSGADWLRAHALTALEAALQARVVITWG
ncbi:MAG: hypothetical protein ABFD14_03955 [Anaerolineaceae bacterium]